MNKKSVVMTGMMLGLIALLPACWPFSSKTQTKSEPDLYVINVLDKNSYTDCRIAGSINVPFEEVEKFAQGINKESEVVVYCANYMCSASSAAAQKLKEMGFERVWAYEGGTAEWYQMGLKNDGKYGVEGTCQASYLTADNQRAAEGQEEAQVSVITADELYNKMVDRGIIAMGQAPASVESATPA